MVAKGTRLNWVGQFAVQSFQEHHVIFKKSVVAFSKLNERIFQIFSHEILEHFGSQFSWNPLIDRADAPSAEEPNKTVEFSYRLFENFTARRVLVGTPCKYPSQLSGGQQQRVAVARALGGHPSILLADEPTGNLDSHKGESVMQLLQDLHREGATICMVTHDPRFVKHAEREIHLFDGKVVAEEDLNKLMQKAKT